MKKNIMKLLGVLSVALTFVLIGCSAAGTSSSQEGLPNIEGTAIADSGTLILKVNPEIAIEYDENGKVTSIRGVNDDGKVIIENYPDFIGKDSGQVLKDLIVKIGEAGYFVEEVEGEARQIVLELEAGSALPNNEFLEHMAVNAQKAVEEYKLNSEVTVEGETYLSLEEVKEIAFKHAGVDGTNAIFNDEELDSDDGVMKYELEFEIGENEYEYDIHAITGEVLDFEINLEEQAKSVPEKSTASAKPAKPAAPASNGKNGSGYDDSAYGQKVAPAKTAAPAATIKPVHQRHDDSDYDDLDYTDYDYTDYDDSDYDDSDYD